MAPLPPTKHSRTVRSAKDPRGIYAPPPVSSISDLSAADLHTGPSTALKRKREATLDDNDDDAFAEFRVSKKDKRSLRHQALLTKVREGGVQKPKRRRPGKKLKADLGGLAEALPDADVDAGVEVDGDGEEEWEGVDEDGDEGGVAGMAGMRKAKKKKKADVEQKKMPMKSLRHRPGAMKRKRVMEGKERERFGRNLARMVGQPEKSAESGKKAGSYGPGASEVDRWAALRSFIGGTMEKSEVFGKG
ncbi:hypothetical protein LTR53_000636 [Teratosphaeriaceae sp. CCFEE 6253]|nr:hypothetical protein LTR53_000636 [Teratosphaeriaceae sp. CCFEE 6253]